MRDSLLKMGGNSLIRMGGNTYKVEFSVRVNLKIPDVKVYMLSCMTSIYILHNINRLRWILR